MKAFLFYILLFLFPTIALAEKPSIVTDPFQWLKQPLDCDGFRDQFKARYGPLGPYAGLNEEKQAEVRGILDYACVRFQNCQFRNCTRAAAGTQLIQQPEHFIELAKKSLAKTEPDKDEVKDALPERSPTNFSNPDPDGLRQLTPDELNAMAASDYHRALDAKSKRQRSLIEKQIAYEATKNLNWMEFDMPDEAQGPSETNNKPAPGAVRQPYAPSTGGRRTTAPRYPRGSSGRHPTGQN